MLISCELPSYNSRTDTEHSLAPLTSGCQVYFFYRFKSPSLCVDPVLEGNKKNNLGPTKNLFKMLFYETSRLDWDGKKKQRLKT